jgi:rare lipoprotein A
MKLIILISSWVILTASTFKSTWYGKSFHGQYTFSGEVFDMNKLTCASNHFAIGTKLKVINLENKKSVIVRVNDRGAMDRYIIDLSQGAFKRIANLDVGIINVKVKIIK